MRDPLPLAPELASADVSLIEKEGALQKSGSMHQGRAGNHHGLVVGVGSLGSACPMWMSIAMLIIIYAHAW
jgi:hypothetical protein